MVEEIFVWIKTVDAGGKLRYLAGPATSSGSD